MELEKFLLEAYLLKLLRKRLFKIHEKGRVGRATKPRSKSFEPSKNVMFPLPDRPKDLTVPMLGFAGEKGEAVTETVALRPSISNQG